jgi:DNA-binding response OmpR family regulator
MSENRFDRKVGTRVLAAQACPPGVERLADRLRAHGYHTESVDTGAAVLDRCAASDLLLLDLDLPDVDGLAVCRAVRAACDVPVIALTEGSTEAERVLALQSGADDCLSRPYGLRELLARMEALLRRTCRPPGAQAVVERDGLRVDARTRAVSLHGRPIPVTRKEFDLLHTLASSPERVFSREELMARVWRDADGAAQWTARTSRTLDTHVNTLRNKIGTADWIVTVRGVGFRLGADRRAPAMH